MAVYIKIKLSLLPDMSGSKKRGKKSGTDKDHSGPKTRKTKYT